MGTSQLGGVVYGNTNLNQNADIILNEVGSTDRSVLKGALEIETPTELGFAMLIKSTPFAVVSINVVGLLVVSTT
jgi:hypothetical protein